MFYGVMIYLGAEMIELYVLLTSFVAELLDGFLCDLNFLTLVEILSSLW